MDRTDGVEALRRRLYRPDASEEDRRRYATALPPAPSPTPSPAAPRRRRAPVALAAAGVVVLAAAGITVARGAVHPEPGRASAAPPASSATALALTIGGPPVHGTGSRAVALDVAAVSLSGGTFSVLLSSRDERPSGWRAIRLRSRRDWSEYPQLLRSSPARDRLAATRPDVFAYTGDAPRRIEVQAAPGEAWTLAVRAGG